MKRCKLIFMAIWMLFPLVAWSTSWASPGDLKWKYSSSGGRGEIIVVDSKGNRIMAATSKSGSVYYWHVVSLDKDGHLNWQKTERGEGEYNRVKALAIDSKDNVIVVGYQDNGTNEHCKVISYSSSGTTNWEATYFAPHGSIIPVGMSVDSKDNVIVVCYESNDGDLDWKVISYSPSGDINWETSYDSGYGDDVPNAVAINSKDDAIVIGYVHSDARNEDWKIISYSPSGGVNWQASYDGGYYDYSHAVAVDSKDNVIVVGLTYNGSDNDWKVISYSNTGTVNWSDTYDNGHGWESAEDVAIDSNDNAIVVGYERVASYSSSGTIKWEKMYEESSSLRASVVAVDSKENAIVGGYRYNGSDDDWKIVSFSPSGIVNWQASYDSKTNNYEVSAVGNEKDGRREAIHDPNDDKVVDICIDKVYGDIVVAGSILNLSTSLIIDCEGIAPLLQWLKPGAVSTIDPAAEDPDPGNGAYLGFGDVVSNGTHFKVEAEFPAYLRASDNSSIAVKVFIAAQMPDDYSRLAYFDSANNLKYQPPEALSSWKSSVTGAVAKTTVYPEIYVTSSSVIPSGTHYWYTLVVPDTVPDDFAGVDWSITPWEITVNVFEVR